MKRTVIRALVLIGTLALFTGTALATEKIVFVCTGNTCRSPMAEGIAKKIALNEGYDVEIFSRGTKIDPNEVTANLNAILTMIPRNIRINDHKSLLMSPEDAKTADIILTMTESHKKGLLELYPDAAPRTFTLTEYATGEQGNISDPWGMDLPNYEATAAQLEKLIPLALKKFTSKP